MFALIRFASYFFVLRCFSWIHQLFSFFLSKKNYLSDSMLISDSLFDLLNVVMYTINTSTVNLRFKREQMSRFVTGTCSCIISLLVNLDGTAAQMLYEYLLGHCSSLASRIPTLGIFVGYRKRGQKDLSQYISVLVELRQLKLMNV